MAGTVASERQLIGIINLDDSLKAASSVDRPSSLDPLLSLADHGSGRSSEGNARTLAPDVNRAVIRVSAISCENGCKA
jgi:hypothetical protein